jgi:hypothetical protein
LRSQFLTKDIHVYKHVKNNSLNSRKIVKKEGLFRDGVDGSRCVYYKLLIPQSMGSGIADPVNIDIK